MEQKWYVYVRQYIYHRKDWFVLINIVSMFLERKKKKKKRKWKNKKNNICIQDRRRDDVRKSLARSRMQWNTFHCVPAVITSRMESFNLWPFQCFRARLKVRFTVYIYAMLRDSTLGESSSAPEWVRYFLNACTTSSGRWCRYVYALRANG